MASAEIIYFRGGREAGKVKAGQVSRRRTPKQQNGGKKRRARLQGKLGRNGGEREEGGMEGGREGGREEGRERGRELLKEFKEFSNFAVNAS